MIILAIFRFAHDYIFVLFLCGIATSAYYDVKEVIRPSLFSPGHDFEKPNFWRV